ncbi:hypothetical protein [Nonomuraea salmonea]|uniref:hypothetical protein n=1 Tax=Nonomuraea salmonea TaxID=46181 RepID=UPI0031E66323
MRRVVLIVFSVVFIYPFVIQVANSFKTDPDAAANPLSPIPPTRPRCRPSSGSSSARTCRSGWATRCW